MKPQCRAVLDELAFGPMTQQDAIRLLGCYRLAARIADLRADGYAIVSESVTRDGVRFARYRLQAESVQLVAGL